MVTQAAWVKNSVIEVIAANERQGIRGAVIARGIIDALIEHFENEMERPSPELFEKFLDEIREAYMELEK